MKINAYHLIIGASLITILSYLYIRISKATNIPSVLLLICTGVGLQYGLDYFDINITNDVFPILELLGIVGLIMIVLEAALELELKKEKLFLIVQSFSVALVGLIGSMILIASVLTFFLRLPPIQAFIYATPLSIMSSAIIIPSVGNLDALKKEFMVYESTFSDILGIIAFYLIVDISQTGKLQASIIEFSGNLLLTIVISIVTSFIIIFIFQNITSHIKLFLLIAILLLLYSIGKIFHLSSLIIILIFGLILANHHLFAKGFLKKWLKSEVVHAIEKDLCLITGESAFLVRTFFFVIFGFTISVATMFKIEVIQISLSIILAMYLIRWLTLVVLVKKNISPQVFIAPRGLITILLLFSIPDNLRLIGEQSVIVNDVILSVIIVSSIIMTFSLIQDKRKKAREIRMKNSNDIELEIVPSSNGLMSNEKNDITNHKLN